jgi:hypothetical protein
MTRLILALAAWISLVSVASASLSPRKEPLLPRNTLPQAPAAKPAAGGPEQVAGQETRSEFVVTDRTEVLLDGRPCRYEEVPGNARVVRMEVAADKKTVLTIHLRTGK